MTSMAYHRETQKRYYQAHKKDIIRKRIEYQAKIRKLAKLAQDMGLDKNILTVCEAKESKENEPK